MYLNKFNFKISINIFNFIKKYFDIEFQYGYSPSTKFIQFHMTYLTLCLSQFNLSKFTL